MIKKKSRFLQTPIEPFAVESGLTADEILSRMERISFQGRNLATAHRIWQKMLEDDVTIFLGVAGALKMVTWSSSIFCQMRCADVTIFLGMAGALSAGGLRL